MARRIGPARRGALAARIVLVRTRVGGPRCMRAAYLVSAPYQVGTDFLPRRGARERGAGTAIGEERGGAVTWVVARN